MSAVVGLYSWREPVVLATLEAMAATLEHRGSDGRGVWCDGPVGLGHQMLWTTPESLGETLPYRDVARDLVITADARIDNREELIKALNLTEAYPEILPDSRLILKAYEQWGESCPGYLLGDFAFIIWDGQKQQLFCARDHFGVKPLYYFQDAENIALATEIKALLKLPNFVSNINEGAIAAFLAEGKKQSLNSWSTFYEGVFRLPSGHCLTASQGNVKVEAYYALDPSRELCLGSDEEYTARFQEIFTEAVRCRLRSAYPVGAMLSGGLDSSAITSVARQLMPGDAGLLKTFSLVFNNFPECDERHFIKQVEDSGDVEACHIIADSFTPLMNMSRLLELEDQPFFAPGLFSTRELYKVVESKQARVLLNGHGGDECVSQGYGRLAELAQQGKWQTLWTETKLVSKIHNTNALYTFWNYWAVFGWGKARSSSRLLMRVSRYWRGGLRRMNRDTAGRRHGTKSFVRPFFSDEGTCSGKPPGISCPTAQKERTARAEHYNDLAINDQARAFEILNHAAADLRLEPRYPFWDKRLVEFCLSLPADQKLRHGWGRFILRRAMTGTLPDSVRWRKDKTNFSRYVAEGLGRVEKECLARLLRPDQNPLEPYVNLSVLRAAVDTIRDPRHQSIASKMFEVTKAMSLHSWIETH